MLFSFVKDINNQFSLYRSNHTAFLLILPALFLLLSGCRKQDDESRPTINFVKPEVNKEFSAGDSVRVLAAVSDNKRLSSIQLSLVNDQLVNMTTPRLFYPDENDYNIDLNYPLDNPNLENGSYELLIIANDGINTTRKFRTIRVRGLEQDLENIIIVRKLNSQVSGIDVLDPSLNLDTTFSIQQRYGLSAVSSNFGLFCYSKGSPSVLTAYNTFNYDPEWVKNASLPHPEYVFAQSDEYLYVSTGNGDIFGFGMEGEIVFQTAALELFVPEVFHVFDDRLVAEQVSRNGLERFLIIYYLETGIKQNRINISSDVAGISSSQGRALVFLNEGLDGVVRSLDPDEFVYTEEQRLEGINISSVTRIDERTFLVPTVEGIFEYDHYLKAFTDYSSLEVELLRYDPFSNRIFAARGSELILIDYASGNEIDVIDQGSEILDLHILFNK